MARTPRGSSPAPRPDDGAERARTLRVGRDTIRYVVRRSARRRRTVEIAVAPDGRVRVSAPVRWTLTEIEALVLRRADWILEKLAALRRQPSGARRQWCDGETLRFLGREYPVHIVSGRGPEALAVQLRNGRIEVRVPAAEHDHARRRLAALAVERWYRQEAERHLAPRVADFAARLGVQPQAVQIRGPRRRWGSCSADGVLRFNWRIMMAPPEVVDYVVVHELCHLLHPHHQAPFWDAVAAVLPDYRERRKALRAQDPAYSLE